MHYTVVMLPFMKFGQQARLQVELARLGKLGAAALRLTGVEQHTGHLPTITGCAMDAGSGVRCGTVEGTLQVDGAGPVHDMNSSVRTGAAPRACLQGMLLTVHAVMVPMHLLVRLHFNTQLHSP